MNRNSDTRELEKTSGRLRMVWLVFALIISWVLLGSAPAAGYAQVAPDTATNPSDEPDGRVVDPNPYAILTGMITTLDELIAAGLDRPTQAAVQKVRAPVKRALDVYTGVDTDLVATVRELGKVIKKAEAAQRRTSDRSTQAILRQMEDDSMQLATYFAGAALEQAQAIPGYDRRLLARVVNAHDKGLAAMSDGNYNKAIPHMVNTLKLANKGKVFDVDLFEQEILDTFSSEVVGFSYAINRAGLLAAADGVGAARTAADGFVAQSATKEMNVASLTKTITAVQVLWYMQYGGIDVDDPIGPYLPWDWQIGDGVAELTFRHLLTHQSGLNNNNPNDCGTSLSALQTCFGTDITIPKTAVPGYVGGAYPWNYNNANFAIFRVIYKFMTGVCDNVDPCPATTDANTSEVYRTSVQCSIFLLMGLSQPDFNPGCSGPDLKAQDTNPTLFYGLPGDLFNGQPLNGYVEVDWTNVAGGGGWYMSAVEMAQFMAHLRFNNQVLSPAARQAMYQGFLGFGDPVAFANRVVGNDGALYHVHGGVLQYGGPLNGRSNTWYHFSCLYDFGSGIQAVILINGAQATDRCIGLKNAYESSWVAK